MNRTFTTASVVSLPTRRTTPSWITRSSLAWIGFDMSTSSSSSTVLPLELRLDGQGFARHGDGVGRATYQDLQVRRRERLGEIIPRAGAQRVETRIDAGVAGDHEDDGVRVRLQAGAQQAQAGDLGHIEVEEHDVELVALQRLARLVATATQAELIPLVLTDAGGTRSHSPFVRA